MKDHTKRDESNATAQTTEHHFGVRDDKGREVAARITMTQGVEFVPQDEGKTWGYTTKPGTYVLVRCQQTRAGKAFGASQPESIHATLEEAQAKVTKYLANARKRAEKNWGAAPEAAPAPEAVEAPAAPEAPAMSSEDIYAAMRADTKRPTDVAALLRLTAQCMVDVLGEDVVNSFDFAIEAGELEQLADEIEDADDDDPPAPAPAIDWTVRGQPLDACVAHAASINWTDEAFRVSARRDHALTIYQRAAADLGPDLGGYSLVDLLADNTDWDLSACVAYAAMVTV